LARDGPSRSSRCLFGQLSANGWLPALPGERAPGSFGRKGMEPSRAPRSSAARRPPTRKAAIVCRLSCAGPGAFLPARRSTAWWRMDDDLSGKTKALTGLSGVASGRFGSIAPRHRAHADEPIAHASAFGFGVEAGGTDRPPTVQHDRAPGVLGLDLETDHIASPTFITNGRHHPPGVERRRRTPQTHPPACLNAEA